MRHAVLGAGGVGGLLGAALARSGAGVVLLMRAESLSRYEGHLTVDSHVLGSFEVLVPATSMLDRDVDVLWVTPKATQLIAALALAPTDRVKAAHVIPLMNGIDHMSVLRSRFETVIAGTMRVASQRRADGRIMQTSSFIRIDLAGADGVADGVAVDVSAAGIECHVSADELSLLWQKLVFLAPLALATTAADGPLGVVRHDPAYVRAEQEVLDVAHAEGARIDLTSLEALRAAAPDTMRSSMQHDVELGHAPEIDAIAGPILRAGREHGIAIPAIDDLVELVLVRARATGSREAS